MLAIAFAVTAQHFELRTATDYVKMREYPFATFYMLSDAEINTTELQGLAFEGEFFGNGHQLVVSGQQPLFQQLEGAIFQNVSIVVTQSSTFCANLIGARFLQSNITSNYVFSVQTRYGSFKSVVFDCKSEMFHLVYDSVFQGCKIQGIQFANLSYNNTLIRIYANLKRSYAVTTETEQHKFGALANTMVFDTLEHCTMILNITGTQTGNLTLGGLAGQGLSVIVKNSDFAANIELAKSYGNVGGMFGEILTNDTKEDVRSLHNISVALNIKTSSQSEGLQSSKSFKGGVAGFINQTKVYLLGISVFIKADFLQNSSQYCVIFGGIAGYIDRAQQVQACATFGQVTTYSYAALVGGVVGVSRGSNLQSTTAFSKCVSNVDITVMAGLNVSVGGFAGLIGSNFEMLNCEALGPIKLYTGQVNTSLATAIAIGGFAGAFQTGSKLKECYTASAILAKAENSLVTHPLVIGGLIAYLDGSNVERCIVYSKEISTNQNFCQIYFGGFFGTTNRTALSVSYSYVFIGSADIQYTVNDQTDVRIGGAVGSPSAQFTFANNFVQMNLTANKNGSDKILIGQLMGSGTTVNSNSVNYLAINYTDASGYELDISGLADPTAMSYNLHVDCSLKGNLKSIATCKEDMHTEEYAKSLGMWRFMSDGDNNNYPSQVQNLYIDRNGSFASGTTQLGYKDYYMDAGLAFPNWKYDFCQGVCVGDFVSPLTFKCETGAEEGAFCIAKNMDATFKKQLCGFISDGEVCSEGLPVCKHNYDFASGALYCEKSCTACDYGFCSAGKCVCDYSISGDACDKFSCPLADNPCNGLGTCQGDACMCRNQQALYDWHTGACTVACPNLRPGHGQCVASGVAVCASKYAGKECTECAEGLGKLADDCVVRSQYGAVIAAIVIGVLFVVLAVAFGIYAFINYRKRQKAVNLTNALQSGVVEDNMTFI